MPQARYSLGIAALLLFWGGGYELFAQRQATCDSVESAWLFYHDVDFEKARILIGHCEEPPALELRAFIALKEHKTSLADTLLCKLFARARNYEFNPKRLPPPGLSSRLERLRKNYRKECEPKLFGLRHPPLLIERDTNLLRLWEVNLGVSSNWGRDEGVKNPVIFHARSNFVELAELEFRTIEIINDLEDGQAQLPTLAVRTQFPLYRMHAQLPVLSALFRTSIELWDWDSDKREDLKFQKKLKEARLFLSSFDYWRTFEFHAGVIMDKLEACVYEGTLDTLCEESGSKLNLFAALQWRATTNALLMMAWETIPEYQFDNDNNAPGKPGTQQVITLNLRAFPASWLAFDLGGIWYKDVRENNFHLSIGTTLGFSWRKILK